MARTWAVAVVLVALCATTAVRAQTCISLKNVVNFCGGVDGEFLNIENTIATPALNRSASLLSSELAFGSSLCTDRSTPSGACDACRRSLSDLMCATTFRRCFDSNVNFPDEPQRTLLSSGACASVCTSTYANCVDKLGLNLADFGFPAITSIASCDANFQTDCGCANSFFTPDLYTEPCYVSGGGGGSSGGSQVRHATYVAGALAVCAALAT